MGVPEQVRKQSAAVQELYKDLNGNGAEDKPIDGDVQAAAQQDNVQSVPQADNPQAEQVQETPAANEPVAGGQEDETFEQKYRTLQGMYNSQVPTLNSQVKELTQRLEQTQQLLATMQQAKPEEAPKKPDPVSLLSDAEREEYGDSIDVMRKVTHEVIGPYQVEIDRLNGIVDQLSGQVVPRIDQIQQQQHQSAEQNFWSSLSAQVPDWRDINDNQDFQTWLLEVDPLTGMTRQSYLDDAQQKLDASRVATFFTAWRNASGNTAQPKQSATSELEKQVSPGRSRSTSAPQGEDKPNFTQADIAKFYKDVSMGRYKGREDERGRIERDIFAAQAEGRIVQS